MRLAQKKYRWNRRKAILMIRRFMEADDRMIVYSDDNQLIDKLRQACDIIDRLSDRFEITANDLQPTSTGKGPGWLLNTILAASSIRYIPTLRGIEY